MCVLVCALFICTATLCVCACVCSFFNWAWLQLSLNQIWLLSTIHTVSSSLRSPTLGPHFSPFFNPRQGPSTAPTGPASHLSANYWSSFILLRAEPALNHSIWVSLKVWFRVMESWLPSPCLITAVRGWKRQTRPRVSHLHSSPSLLTLPPIWALNSWSAYIYLILFLH